MSGYYPDENEKINDDDNVPDDKIDLLPLNVKEPEKNDKLPEEKKSIISYLKEYSNNIITKYVIVYLLFILSTVFYLKSLKGCTSSPLECQSSEYMKFYVIIGVYAIISCALLILLLILNYIMELSKLNYLVFFTIYIIFFSTFKGTDFEHHGTYNMIGFILFFIFISLIIFFLYKIGFYCYNRERKKWFSILLIIIIIIIIFNLNTQCSNFYNGMGGEKIINDPSSDACEFQYPSSCGLDIFTGISLFDLNLFRHSCEGIKNKKDIFLKYIDKSKDKYNNFSFPRTEHWPPKESFFRLADKVDQNIKEIESNTNKDLNEREVFVSFDEERGGKVEIHLKKNNTLIEERRAIAENNPVKFENIYILYLDGVSRNHFRRKMKKTTKIIEKMLYLNRDKNKDNSVYDNYNAFQFFKYHNFDSYTIGNNLPFIYGSNMHALTGISMTKFMKEKGFITCATHNSCNKELFDWEDSSFRQLEFSDWDHENFALFCDTNYEDKSNVWDIFGGKSSMLRRCFYGRDSFEYAFDYVSQFLEAYKNERKFFKIMLGDAHELTMEVVKFIDNKLAPFLEDIINNYSDDKTAIILMSDHGAQFPGPYDILFHKEKKMELYLGVFLLILPKNSNNNTINHENIFYNQQKFITTFDIHDSLLDMINIEKMKYPQMDNIKGQSLFEKINGSKRSCKTYKEELNDCYCKSFSNK